MKKVKVGINGFGRIGSLILRASFLENENIQIVGINDPFLTVEYAAYMLKHDSVHGAFNADIAVDKGDLIVNGNRIKYYAQMNPENIDWRGCGAEVIAEATGKFTKIEDASRHLAAGAKKVVITAPGKGTPVFVYGVNEKNTRQVWTLFQTPAAQLTALRLLLRLFMKTLVSPRGL